MGLRKLLKRLRKIQIFNRKTNNNDEIIVEDPSQLFDASAFQRAVENSTKFCKTESNTVVTDQQETRQNAPVPPRGLLVT